MLNDECDTLAGCESIEYFPMDAWRYDSVRQVGIQKRWDQLVAKHEYTRLARYPSHIKVWYNDREPFVEAMYPEDFIDAFGGENRENV